MMRRKMIITKCGETLVMTSKSQKLIKKINTSLHTLAARPRVVKICDAENHFIRAQC